MNLSRSIVVVLMPLGMLSACGARTDLRAPIELERPVTDAAVDDVSVPLDAAIARCTQGVLTDFGTSECGGNETDWFATPYTPPSAIRVERLEAFMAHGNVALLTSVGGAPGTVLFTGSVGTSPRRTWLGADVSPAVSLDAGTLYFIGFQGTCSFAAGGPEPIEYMASSLAGPWHSQGTDNWTARLIGSCP